MFRIMTALTVAAHLATASWAQDDNSGSEPTGRTGDLGILRTEIVDVDASYADAARAAAIERITELQSRASELSDAEFGLAVAEIAALSENGHSQVLAPAMAAGLETLPVRFLLVNDQLYIAAAANDLASLVHREVVSICGHALGELRRNWARYATGRQGYQDQSLYYLIEIPALLEASGLCPTESVGIGLADGETVSLESRRDIFPAAEGIWRFLPEARVINLAQQGLISAAPLYLQEPESVFRLVEMPGQDAAYIQFRSNIDFSGQIDLREVASTAIGTLREMAPSVIIVDQRFNLGGDLNTTRNLMQAIPEIVGETGEIYIITSGRTFSAGISSTGYLKQAGGDRVTIVGEPIGDSLEFWAEGDPVRLPDSGIMVMRATERHNYMTGCPEADCHSSIQAFPIRVDSLEPDVSPSFTYADIIEGRDPWLEAIFTMMNGQ
jgi:hypothetical protein